MTNKHTVERLIIYNRVLKELLKNKVEWVTSKKIGELIFRTPAQVRRDLSSLGKKGKPGVGYESSNLIKELDRVLGLNKTWGVILVGAGNLGRALFHYPGFKREGFEFRVVVDNNSMKIAKKWKDVRINPAKDIKRKIKQKNISIAIIAVPESSAQQVADVLIEAGIKEILNFAPVTLNVDKDVNVRYADLALDLENLSYHLSYKKGSKTRKKNAIPEV